MGFVNGVKYTLLASLIIFHVIFAYGIVFSVVRSQIPPEQVSVVPRDPNEIHQQNVNVQQVPEHHDQQQQQQQQLHQEQQNQDALQQQELLRQQQESIRQQQLQQQQILEHQRQQEQVQQQQQQQQQQQHQQLVKDQNLEQKHDQVSIGHAHCMQCCVDLLEHDRVTLMLCHCNSYKN